MFYVRLQQQLCGKHDVWHNFRDENYFKKKKLYLRHSRSVNKIFSQHHQTVYKKHAIITDKFGMKLSTHPESTVARKIYRILPCRNEILHTVLG